MATTQTLAHTHTNVLERISWKKDKSRLMKTIDKRILIIFFLCVESKSKQKMHFNLIRVHYREIRVVFRSNKKRSRNVEWIFFFAKGQKVSQMDFLI